MILQSFGYLDSIGPRYFIELQDKNLATELIEDITHFEYEDDEKKTSTLKLTVNNRALKYMDNALLAQPIRVKFRFGYVGDVSDVKMGTFVKARPTFPSGGVPTLELIAFDLRRDLDKSAHPKNWGAIQSSQIARSIADRYNLDSIISDSKDARSQHRTQAANITDFQYLLKLAEPLSWDFFVEGRTLHFHPKDVGDRPVFDFTYFTDGGSNLLEFSPTVDLNRPPSTAINGVDQKKAEAHSKESSEGHGTEPSSYLGRSVLFDDPAIGNRFITARVDDKGQPIGHSTPESSKSVITKHSGAYRGKVDMAALKASATVVGSPRLRARQNITINGVGRVYSGIWRITATRHIIQASGQVYVTQLTLARNATNNGKKKVDPSKVNSKETKEGGDVSGMDVRYVTTQGVPVIGQNAQIITLPDQRF